MNKLVEFKFNNDKGLTIGKSIRGRPNKTFSHPKTNIKITMLKMERC